MGGSSEFDSSILLLKGTLNGKAPSNRQFIPLSKGKIVVKMNSKKIK